MIKSIAGMLGTNDLTEWESEFVRNINTLTDEGAKSSILTSKQVEIVERIYRKHFA